MILPFLKGALRLRRRDLLSNYKSMQMTDSDSLPPSSLFDFFRHKEIYFMGIFLLVVGFTIVCLIVYSSFLRAPKDFPTNSLITIRNGMTIHETSILLADRNAIRSPFLFKSIAVLLGGNGGIKAGDYYLFEPVSAFVLVRRLVDGSQDILQIRVTIPEGLNNNEVAARLFVSFPHFNQKKFLELAKSKEGYLFPDTYIFLQNATEAQIIGEMENNFMRRIKSIKTEIAAFGKSQSEIVIMASLIEDEARTTESRRTIAGILWKRLKIGMPLQVDAVFPYIFGRQPFDLTNGDLKIDSTYNTYKYTGLPPGPINNPGLDSILSAVTPIETPYLYYLSDKNGEMHYARTHAEHLVNRAKYLGK